ncbi:endonuclease/exonuclease/phosphatase family metal-dependent hydrolase [Aliiruegeria haliotis]|uniref:Endonuclease/exonuclease/phosphatase family metal-dependent hydrolase n=1 Tax=Aliiruegeria haliotis TaxID=1280846 RepID=A0A2T0RZK2_9RHOB|nr:endonuclease/exonuclease/phosphatase family protein [Aliiruegeria haliotis]PRY26595.1 endonuclease/exonuclease/phosphatase family metal-dependent hydrolase [Aliiruegeria haliotis]
MKLRLASYNIQKAVGVDFRRDPMRILDVVNGLDADVVALQEVDKRLGERPSVLCRKYIEEETDFRIAPLSRNEVSLGWHGNAVLVHRDLEITATEHIELPGLEPRGAVRVDVETEAGPLSVVGTHLGLVRYYRRLQLETIRARLGGRLGRSVIMGDFNEWSEDRGMEPLAGAFDIVNPGNSFHAARPIAGLDRFALGKAARLHDAGVEEGDLASWASDHLPIWSDVQLDPVSPVVAVDEAPMRLVYTPATG